MEVHTKFRFLALFLLVAIAPLVTSQRRQNKTWPDRTFPGMQQFPSRDELILMVKGLDGYVITPSDSNYANEIKMYNSRVDRFPFAVVMVKSIKDIKAVLQMAKKYDLLISIRSSGHSFIGSSTHDGSIVINLKNMKGIRFNLNSTRNPAGEVTVESGNTWLDVYKEVDKQVTQDRMGNSVRRVIAGGSAHAVAMGGYTQGGGHSPMGRRLGLAVDNLLEATIILADGRKAVVSAQGIQLTDFNGNVTVSNDTSLFWAIRGGGGGTWGVVVDFTFKLHFAPQRIRNVGLNWALRYQGHDIGSDTIRFVMQQVANLSSDWGGYVTIYGGPLNNESSGYLSVFLNHFGSNNSSSNNEINQLLNYNLVSNQYLKFDRNFSTFLQYEMTVSDPEFVNTYVFDSFIQPGIVNDSQQLEEFVRFGMDLLNSPPYSIYSCTGALIGGKMREVPDGETPVHPKFRSGLLAMTCGIGWPAGTGYDDYFIGTALEMQDRLAQLGNGSYFNEAAEDLTDWKTQFWGTSETYNRLLYVKRKWDPENFFWCHNCVGSDEKAVCPRRAAGGWVFLPGASN